MCVCMRMCVYIYICTLACALVFLRAYKHVAYYFLCVVCTGMWSILSLLYYDVMMCCTGSGYGVCGDVCIYVRTYVRSYVCAYVHTYIQLCTCKLACVQNLHQPGLQLPSLCPWPTGPRAVHGLAGRRDHGPLVTCFFPEQYTRFKHSRAVADAAKRSK